MRRLNSIWVCSLAALLLNSWGKVWSAPAQPAYAETDSCADCHDKQWNQFKESSHGFAGNRNSPAAKRGCQTCHGPAQAHVDSMGKVPVLNLDAKTSTLSATERSGVCLQCHDKGKPELWHGSKHEIRGLSCQNCHSIHGGNPKNLKFPTPNQLCVTCHKDIRSQLGRFSHHPIREGKLQCSDCHNPHGTRGEKLLQTNTVNETCWSCHAEHRGPFLWDHAPVRENCLTCHTPHGSSHERLLQANVPLLCQRCHSNPRHPGTIYAANTTQAGLPVYEDTVGTNLSRLMYRSCLNCHSMIHGSNHPSGRYFHR